MTKHVSPTSDGREPFLRAVEDAPDDDAPRLVYADWLEEHGDEPRAELIRLQVEAARLPDSDPRRAELAGRADQIRNARQPAWLSGLPASFIKGAVFERGFIRLLSTSDRDFLRGAAALFTRETVQELNVGFQLDPARFFACEHLRHLRALSLPRNRLAGGAATALAESPHLNRLTYLDLRWNQLEEPDVARLAASPHLSRLADLDLRGNSAGADGARALADSLSLAGLQRLDLGGNDIGDAGLASLAAARFGPRLEALELQNNGIGDAGCKRLAASRGLRRLRYLGLEDNSRIGPAGIAALVRAAVFARVEELRLDGSLVGAEGARALAQSRHARSVRRLTVRSAGLTDAELSVLLASPVLKQVELLALDNNYFAEDGLVAFARSRYARSIRELRLTSCSVGDDGAKTLAQAALPRLATLELSHNPIGPEGINALADSRLLDGVRELGLPGRFGLTTARKLAASPHLSGITAISFSTALSADVRKVLKARFKTAAHF